MQAIQEVRPALILSTLAIIASFLPLMFITGMMGPYMAPMALNVPLTIGVSMVVAFVITPWLAMVALRKLIENRGEDEPAYDLDEAADLPRQPGRAGPDPRPPLAGLGHAGRGRAAAGRRPWPCPSSASCR